MVAGLTKTASRKKLGANHYINSASADPGQALQELGGAALVIVTSPVVRRWRKW